MRRYLLDTNHISAAIQPVTTIREVFGRAVREGARIGTCIPALCEVEVGIQGSSRQKEKRRMLADLLGFVKIWPLGLKTARAFGELALEAKSKGRVLSQVDLMLAALARAENLTILTTDKDFAAFPDISTENWLE